MNYKHYAAILIPSVYSWLLASLLLLIYPFDLLNFVESLSTNPFAGMEIIGAILLASILIWVMLVLYFTGVFLDKNPSYLKLFILVGMVGSSIMIILFIIFIENILLMIICLTGLSFFAGILITSSGTAFAGLIDTNHRGRSYSYAISAFIVIAIISMLFGGLISSRFQDEEILSRSFVSILLLTGCLGLILSLIFFLLTRDLVSWQNDKWPTELKKIIGRRSVRAYMITHFLLYCMLGLAIASFSIIGAQFSAELSWTLDIPALGRFDLPMDKIFWFTVLIGDLSIILLAGYITDRLGRKNLIVLAIYGIVFAILFFGLEQTPNSFLLSALVIGFSFALIHPTLDSSLWADLSPRDGLSRYNAFGFISLALGLGAGYSIGRWVIPFVWGYTSIDNIGIITYILVVLAVFAALPLFWVSDSYKPLDFSLLLLIDRSGLPIFDYTFQKELEMPIELPLLSGALKAVSSFMSETIKDKGYLNLVQHGKNFIINESQEEITAALFCNKPDPELQNALRDFLDEFLEKYRETVATWFGTPSSFDGAIDIAEKAFGHLAASTNLEE
ncbi:MAG: MFS transporter [Candidatus Hodarchaeales archaeon]|jgi:MFS family permease